MAESSTPIRVYLLDDHEVVRQGLKALLGRPVTSGGGGRVQHRDRAASRIPARSGPTRRRVSRTPASPTVGIGCAAPSAPSIPRSVA